MNPCRTLVPVAILLLGLIIPGQAEDPTITVGHEQWEQAIAWIGVLILIGLSGKSQAPTVTNGLIIVRF